MTDEALALIEELILVLYSQPTLLTREKAIRDEAAEFLINQNYWTAE